MKIALAQLNYHIGNFAENERKIIDAIAKAKNQGAELAVFAKWAIGGGPAGDLLRRPGFLHECRQSVDRIAEHCHGIACMIGAPIERTEAGGKRLYDADLFLEDGKLKAVRHENLRLEDAVFPKFPVILAASPFSMENFGKRLQVLRGHAGPLVYVNQVGAHADMIFDGRSLVLDRNGNLLAELARFAEDFQVVDISESPSIQPEEEPTEIALVHDALILGIRDFFGKSGFKKAVLGLSGGLDSAVVAALACEAMGAENVLAVLMPSVHSSEHSLRDAIDLVENTGCRHEIIPIGDIVSAFGETLAQTFRGLATDVTEENIQARIRGTILMALSNKFGHILLNTSNKSEVAVGYGTLYGDMAGGFAPLKDIPKTLAYRLAHWRNQKDPHTPIIPERILTRAPSAELRPDQTDQDSLPPYEVLDAIVELAVERNQSGADIVATGLPADAVAQVLRLLRVNEYKRQQAPIGPRVTTRAFGEDWRMPITHRFADPDF